MNQKSIIDLTLLDEDRAGDAGTPSAGPVEPGPHAPSTPLETALAEIWQEVLKKDGIRTTDSFLDLGGNSLAMMRVNIRIEELLGIQLSTRDWFGRQTLADLASIVLERLLKP